MQKYHFTLSNKILAAIHIGVTLHVLNLCISPATAQKEQKPVNTIERIEARRDWTQTDLHLDNASYATVRAQIDKLIRQGQKPSALEAKYRLKPEESYNSQAIFRWAYASYRKLKLNPQPGSFTPVEQAMNRNLRPGAYDWVRLRFLIANLASSLPKKELIPVGRRLIELKKDDEAVLFHYVRDLQNSNSLEDRKQSVVLARIGAQMKPHDLYWQWMVADSVFLVGFYGRGGLNYEENQLALAEYKKTLKMVPAKHPYRKDLIEKIVRLEYDFDANGKPVPWNTKDYENALKNTSLR